MIRLVALGKKCAKSRPSTIGKPKSNNTCYIIGPKGISNLGISLRTLTKRLYIEPQKKKLSGVIMGEKEVVIAVNDTDKAPLPFESTDRKLEILPPGQDATRIIPRAIIGEIQCLKAMISTNVSAGRRIS